MNLVKLILDGKYLWIYVHFCLAFSLAGQSSSAGTLWTSTRKIGHMLKSFIGKVTAVVSCEINSVYRGDWAQQSYTPGHWFMQDLKAERVWVSTSHVLSPRGNGAVKSFLLKHCEFGWNAAPAGWYGLGFLWLQERKWAYHEPNYNLLEGWIAADHLRPDGDINIKGAAALIKICFHSVTLV